MVRREKGLSEIGDPKNPETIFQIVYVFGNTDSTHPTPQGKSNVRKTLENNILGIFDTADYKIEV